MVKLFRKWEKCSPSPHESLGLHGNGVTLVSTKTKNCISILLVFLIANIVILFLLNGLTLSNYWTFGGQTTIPLEGGPRVVLWINTHVRSLTALRVKLYSSSRPPYSIKIDIYSDKNQFKAVHLDALTVKYKENSEQIILTSGKSLTIPFKDYEYFNWTDAGYLTNKEMKISYTFTNAVARMEDFSLEGGGQLLRVNGEKLPFSYRKTFEARKVFGFHSGWHLDWPNPEW